MLDARPTVTHVAQVPGAEGTGFGGPRLSSDPTKKGSLLPEPLLNGSKVDEARLSQVPTPEALAKWLKDRGLDTKDWGKDDTKDVSKYWKELKGDEAGLELWRKADGSLQPIRVVHVLRAKVASLESYERGIFCFNTWQQFGDGRTRTRNGLLSEKLTMSEMPLEDHLHEVCERAVTEEEMQHVAESVFRIEPGTPVPTFDPNYKCPLKVVHERFVDHTLELEVSKSYPGLYTMYHLYTVDIICQGLPAVDFNTLEWDHEDQKGCRELKYIHAWVWLEWSQIQRYLLEGSDLKERKKKGSFVAAQELNEWLEQFDLGLEEWGTGLHSSVEDLFGELEKEETHLELWGRTDGVPLLMRVVHVIQLKVGSTDVRQCRKFLFKTWQQLRDGQFRTVNRLMSKKVSTAQLPFTEERFTLAAEEAINEELSYVMDAHFQLDTKCMPNAKDLTKSGVTVSWVRFEDHRVTVEESSSFKGLHTMYHLYSMDVECDGLPCADFSSLEFRQGDAAHPAPLQELRFAHGWRWVKWQQTLDIMQTRTQALVKNAQVERESWQEQQECAESNSTRLRALTGVLEQLAKRAPAGDQVRQETLQLQQNLQKTVESLLATATEEQRQAEDADTSNLAKLLPPSMVSKMSEGLIASKEMLEQAKASAMRQALAQAQRKDAMRSFHGLPAGVASRGQEDWSSDGAGPKGISACDIAVGADSRSEAPRIEDSAAGTWCSALGLSCLACNSESFRRLGFYSVDSELCEERK